MSRFARPEFFRTAMRHKHSLPLGEGLADYDLVGAHQAKDFAGLHVQKVQIQIAVRHAARLVAHLGLGAQCVHLSLNLHPAENAEIALNGGKGEIGAQREQHAEHQKRCKTW